MADVFTNLMSWSLVVGIVIGFVLSKLWALARVCWKDKHEPLPDGRKRSKWRAIGTDRRWLVGMLAVAFLGWSVFTTSSNASSNEHNAETAARFADAVHKCQKILIVSIKGSREVSTDNDRLSREERGLLADGQAANREWIGQLLQPPAEVASLPPGSEARNRYNIDVTQAFFDRVGRIQKRIDAIHDEQIRNERERPPLPDPNCGD